MKKTILFIFGTRPEAIKLAPLIIQMRENPEAFSVKVCVTAQHRELLDSVLLFFGIIADFDLDIMKSNQSLEEVTSQALSKLAGVIDTSKPDLIVVQGDTSTAFVGALAAYYKKVMIAHIEAGLRSHNKYSPYPEEMNRKLISQLADFHFTPTGLASQNLAKEGLTDQVYQVGNSVIDAMFLGLEILKKGDLPIRKKFGFLDLEQKIVLLTAHRRENFGRPFQNVLEGILELHKLYPDLQFVFPVHPNPNIRSVAEKFLGDKKNIFLLPPLDYDEIIWVMEKSYLIISDSGGIQEEAPSLGKPVLVIRNETERMEGIEAGTAKLVGTDSHTILNEASRLISSKEDYLAMSKGLNPYGDGTTADKVINILLENLKND